MIRRSRRQRSSRPTREQAFALHRRIAARNGWGARLLRGSGAALLASLVAAAAGAGPWPQAVFLAGAFLLAAALPVQGQDARALRFIRRNAGLSYETWLELEGHAGEDRYGFAKGVRARAIDSVRDVRPPDRPAWWLPALAAAVALLLVPLTRSLPVSPAAGPANPAAQAGTSPLSRQATPVPPPPRAAPERGPAASPSGSSSGQDASQGTGARGGSGQPGEQQLLSQYLQSLGGNGAGGTASSQPGTAGGGTATGAPTGSGTAGSASSGGTSAPPSGSASGGSGAPTGSGSPGSGSGASQQPGSSAGGGSPAGSSGPSGTAPPPAAAPPRAGSPGSNPPGTTPPGSTSPGTSGGAAQRPTGQGSGASTPQGGSPTPRPGAGTGQGQSGAQPQQGSAQAGALPGSDKGGGSGAGGNQPGTPGALRAPVEGAGSAPQYLPGAVDPAGPSARGALRLPGSQQVTLPPGTSIESYRRAAEQAMTEGNVPLEYQDVIRRYFR